jgi:hypothetical protein
VYDTSTVHSSGSDQLRLVSSHSNFLVIVMPSFSRLSIDLFPSPVSASLWLRCIRVVVKHISSSSGLQSLGLLLIAALAGSRTTVPSCLTSTSSSSCVNCKLSSSSFLEILRVRFFEMVSRSFSGYGRAFFPEFAEDDLLLDGKSLRHGLSILMSRGRRVGRHPLMMPTEGSTELQMKTSLFAQLMSSVWTRRVMVMMR